MKNRTIFMLICCFAFWSGTTLQAEDIFNPENPGDPQSGLLKYSLTVSVTPQNGGETNFTVSKNRAGSEVYLSAYSNTNYIFRHWAIGDSIISTYSSFYYIMPQHDVNIVAVFEPYFNPDSPDDPQVGLKKYNLTVVSTPEHGGYTNYTSWKGREHDRIYLDAYPNTNYAFVHWMLGDSIVSYNGWFEYEMPAKDVTLIAVFKPYFNPQSPADPNANYWNSITGEVIIDNFVEGDLRGAINNKVDDLDQITMLTVVGELSSYDFGAVNNYDNCILFDLSRTSGYTQIPNYAFEYNSALQKIILPSVVEKIGYDAFYNCSNLAELHIYATTPPEIYDNAFYGTSEGLVVKVLPTAIPLYMQHEKWKKFTILPLDEEVRDITVKFPENVELSKFKNFSLEMLNQANGQRYRYIVSDRDSYSFSGLIKNVTYSVALKNKDGVVFGDIKNIELKENDTTVVFESILIPQTLSISVLTPENNDVTTQTQISWFGVDGSFIKRASSIDGYIEGNIVKYSLVLNKELAVEYENPVEAEYVVGKNNNITIVLKPFDLVRLKGVVKDSLNNTALSNATISISQQLNGKYAKSYITSTDANGQFEVDVFDVYSNMTISANEYISRKVEYAQFGADLVDLGIFKIRSITGAIVDLKFTYMHSVTIDAEAEVEEYYSDYNNVSYRIYNKTQQREINNFSVQYPKIVLLEEVKEGDVLVLDVSSRKSSFKSLQIETTIHGDRATANVDILQLGGLEVSYTSTDNRTVTGILYDAKGEMIKKSEYNNGLWSLKELQDGEYTLISMGKSTLFNDMYNLSAFANVGLIEGVDYLKNTITISSGIISTIENEIVPKFDESKLYYTGDNTTFGVNKTSIVAGNYLTLRAKVDFKNGFVGSVDNLNLVIDLPESISFVENSVMVGNSVASYTMDGNRLIIPIGVNDLVRFCIIPTAGGNYAPTAFAQFDIDHKTVMQPIGSANFAVKDLTITVPSIVAKTTIPVSGTAIGKSNIEIYDNGVLIGQTNSLANGVWATTCELKEPYNLSVHNIYAKVVNASGIELQSETKQCQYDVNAVQVKTVTMSFYNGWLNKNIEVVFDFEENATSSSSYMFYTTTNMTFIADLTNNDTSVVSNVKIYVFTDKGEVRELPAKYDARKNKWVSISEFSSDNLPVNVSVDFVAKTEIEVDTSKVKEVYLSYVESDELIQEAFIDSFSISILEDLNDSFVDYEDIDRQLDSIEDSFGYVDYRIQFSSEDSLYIDSLVNASTEEEFFIIWSNVVKKYSGEGETDWIDWIGPYRPLEKTTIYELKLPTQSSTPRIVYEKNENYLTQSLSESNWTVDLSQFENLETSSFGDEIVLIDQITGDKIRIDLASDLPMLGESRSSYASFLESVNNFLGDYGTSLGMSMETLEAWAKEGVKNLKYQQKLLGAVCNKTKQLPNQGPAVAAMNKTRIKGLKNISNAKKASVATSAATKAVGGILTGWQTRNDLIDGFASYDKWEALIGDLYSLCSFSEAEKLEKIARDYQKLDRNKNSGVALLNAGIALGAAVGAGLAPSTLGVSLSITLISGALSFVSGAIDQKFDSDNLNNMNIVKQMMASNPNCKQLQSNDYPDPTLPPIEPIHDPSGYVYEGVPSNRIEGVMASCYYKEVVEDIYGDKHENIVLWDAENYAQENPLFTDENGMYRWDVPQGLWQVKFEKEGYQTTYSEWLPVPPPQLEVNIAMVQNSQPEVSSVRAYENGIEIDFDKYMNIETLNNTNIVVTKNSEVVEGSIVLLNEELASENGILKYASKVRFNPSVAFLTIDEITLTVSKKVKSYANIQMATDYTQSFSITKEVDSIVIDSLTLINYGFTKEIVVSVLPFDAAIGKNLIVTSTSPMIAFVKNDTVVIDGNGQAIVSVIGELPGTASIKFVIENEAREASSVVNVVYIETPIVSVDKPKASILSGSQVDYGTTVSLSCATEEAVIYYTIDGSCPCDTNRIMYVEPIEITQNIIIKAVAVLDSFESDIVEFEYNLKPYTITINAEHGVVLGDSLCLHGDTIILEAIPDVGYHFVCWSDGDTNAKRYIVVESDTILTAEFAINRYSVTLVADYGTVIGSGEYDHGTEITIMAIPDVGYRFVQWSDGETASTRVIVVTEEIYLIAEFAGGILTELENIDSNFIGVFVKNGTLYLEGINSDYRLFDATGKLIYTGRDAQLSLPNGIYLLNVGNKTYKVAM